MIDVKECNICFDKALMNQANIKTFKDGMLSWLLPTKQSLKS